MKTFTQFLEAKELLGYKALGIESPFKAAHDAARAKLTEKKQKKEQPKYDPKLCQNCQSSKRIFDYPYCLQCIKDMIAADEAGTITKSQRTALHQLRLRMSFLDMIRNTSRAGEEAAERNRRRPTSQPDDAFIPDIDYEREPLDPEIIMARKALRHATGEYD